MPGGNPYKILIADDNAVNQRVLLELLKLRGHSVHAVNDGTEVLEALECDSFDLVILDCLMPGMDGYAASRAIRAAERSRLNPDVPILAVSALASAGDRDKCLQAGMDDYISKPVIAETLYRHVDRLLHDCNVHRTERSQGPGGDRGTSPTTTEQIGAVDALGDTLKSMSDRVAPYMEQWQLELTSQLERGNHEDIRFLAHKIRGTADVLGWRQLSRLCAALEHASGPGAELEMTALVPRVVGCLKRLMPAVRTTR